MANLTIILFLCATVPMAPALYMIPDRRSRLILIYLLLGMVVCLIASEINSLLLGFYGGDSRYVSCNITPIVEEVLKALPVLYFAVCFSDDRDTLLSISFAIGLGFAVLENMVILTSSLAKVTILWAFVRGFGAARMHSACTSLIGRGICYVRKRRKLFYCGTFSLLISAVIAHALFNTLIQSQYRLAAYGVVLVMYIPHILAIAKKLSSRKQKEQA
ncbi:MAG: PrsW family intramembrane metalloprotease [Clostridia bacterium]|nr:PrsW family intramembrane metalloprotease [Clostridia bacterium]